MNVFQRLLARLLKAVFGDPAPVPDLMAENLEEWDLERLQREQARIREVIEKEEAAAAMRRKLQAAALRRRSTSNGHAK